MLKSYIPPNGNKVVRCPANETITCKTCKLCQRAERDFVIGFTAHGSHQRKKVENHLQNGCLNYKVKHTTWLKQAK